MSQSPARPDTAPPVPRRLLPAAGAIAAVSAALALWWRFGEGVYGQALLNAVIACF